MAEYFASGRAADLILIVLLVEAIWLIARGRKPTDVLLALLPAAFIVLAVRFALTGMEWPAIALALALAFPFHVADLKRRGLLERDE